jgi:hypothetical protein
MPPAAAYLPEPEPGAEPESGRGDTPDEADRHIRSVTEVTDYRIEARDGDIGHVEDFLVDDEDWAIRYMVVDTRNWWIGRKVLVAPQWIEAVRWRDRHVGVDLTRDQVKAAPDYDWTRPPARDYEERLHGSYGREGYWAPGADTRTFRPRRRA